MPLATARLGREKTIKSLTARLFVIKGRDSEKAQRRAERALLKANPSLANKEGFVAGRVIIVPTGLGLPTTDRVTVTRPDLKGALDETTLRLQLSQGALKEGFARQVETIEKGSVRLSDPKLRKLVRETLPDAAKVIDRATETLKEKGGSVEARQARFEKRFAAALAAVDRVKRQLPDN